jgi:hypothetical protein
MVIGYEPRFARGIKYPEPHKYEKIAERGRLSVPYGTVLRYRFTVGQKQASYADTRTDSGAHFLVLNFNDYLHLGGQ